MSKRFENLTRVLCTTPYSALRSSWISTQLNATAPILPAPIAFRREIELRAARMAELCALLPFLQVQHITRQLQTERQTNPLHELSQEGENDD